ncbi:MAG: FecR domain-containing protein [Leptospirales bacterium]|nr:FecR domain-containing protein [Leptospirales bacterium]
MFRSFKEYRIPAILGLAAVIFLLMFVCDFTRRADIGSREEIGSIIHKKHGVQRRFADQVVWERIDQGGKLANADSIRTADGSEVKIRLKDGTLLTIDENSMIQLDVEKNRIDFTSGSLQVQSGSSSKLTLQSGDNSVKLTDGNVALSKTGKEDLNVTVYEGNAQVTSGGKTESLSKNQKAEVGKDGIQVRDLPVVLIKPNPFQTMAAEGDGTSVAFKFEPAKGISKPTLEISRDAEFSDSKRVNTPGNATMDLAPGTYYWRVTGEDDKTNQKAVSETRKMTIVRGDPLRLQSPATGEKVAFHSNPPSVPFSWTQDSLAESYRLEISKDKDFKEVVRTVTTPGNSATIDDLPAGVYRWRIQTKPSQLDVPGRVSNAGVFEVIKSDLAAPETASPFQKEHFASTVTKEGIFFNWRGTGDMKSYIIQISPSPGFGSSFMNQKTEKNFVMVQGVPDGQYYWRVKGLTADKESPYSAIQSFTVGAAYMKSDIETVDKNKIRPLFPARTAVDMTGKKTLDFRWDAAAGAKKYNFRLFKNNGGALQPIFATTTQAPQVTLTDITILDIGYFAWEVQAEGGSTAATGRVDFSITLNRYLQNLKPGDIQFVNPDTIYREDEQ